MKILLVPFVVFIFSLISLNATVWHVGKSRQYSKPSQVSTIVKNGDTVEIDAGIYSEDVAHWTSSNLLIQGIGGMAHLKSNGQNWGGKAIWVIGGANTKVAFIEFSECTVPDGNGAGIRLEAANLTVHGCYFHDNQNGILAGDNEESDVLIEYCEFSHNGKGDGYTHNLYINKIHSLIFQYNYSHHAKVGHELKSRAYNNYILYNRITNESDGTASREIDLPNGGIAVIMGNEIQQGMSGENSNIIGYGQEGLSNPPPHQLYVVNNTIVNERSAGSFLAVKAGTDVLYSHNNIFAGLGSLIVGSASTIDTSHNWNGAISDAKFVNSKNYDFHLLQTSPAINNGIIENKIVNGILLVPTNEYRHPANITFRIAVGIIDIGAHENTLPSSVEVCKVYPSSNVYPNPSAGNCKIKLSDDLRDNPRIELFDYNGKYLQQIVNYENSQDAISINKSLFPNSGNFLIRISTLNNQQFLKLIINK